MDWREAIKGRIPPPLLNNLLLTFPALYRTGAINYETTLQWDHGVEDLLAELVKVTTLDGDVIECGSSRCGASIIMANYLRAKSVAKVVYAYDSFEGFDRRELRQEQKLGLTNAADTSFTSTSYSYVRKKIRKLGLAGHVIPIKGYFQETLPRLDGSYCFALIDCDLRESLVYCAEAIWPRLAEGGRIVFDDYTSPLYRGARIGVDEFVAQHSGEIAAHGLLRRLYSVRKGTPPGQG